MTTHRILFCLTIALLLTCAIPSFAQQTDQKPAIACFLPFVFMENKIPMVALTPMAEVLGAALSEDTKEKTITISRNDHTFTCAPGTADALGTVDALGNDTYLTLPCPVVRGPDSVFVPIIPMIKALGGKAELTGIDTPGKLPQVIITFPDFKQPLTLRVTWTWPNQTKKLPNFGSSYYVVATDGTGLRAISCDNGSRPRVAFTPDGKFFYYREDNYLYRRATEGHVPEVVMRFPNFDPKERQYICFNPCVDPDGRLTILAKGRFGKWSNEPITDTQIVRILPGKGEKVLGEGFTPSVSPDGRLIAVTVWDAARGIPVARLMNTDGSQVRALGDGADPLFSPNGKYLAWMRAEKTAKGFELNAIVIWPVGGKEDDQCVVKPGSPIGSDWMRDIWGDFSSDSMQLSFLTIDLKAWVVNIDGSGLRCVHKDAQNTRPFFTKDSKSVIVMGRNALINVPLDGGQPKEIVSNMYALPVAMMPDRQHIVFVGEYQKP